MIPILSCDPGTNLLGLALWHFVEEETPTRFVLLRAKLVSISSPREAAAAAIDLAGDYFDAVVEVPQIYMAGKSKGSPNDLVDVALVAGAVLSTGTAGSLALRPYEWKGQTPKEIVTVRTRAALAKGELDRVELPKARSLSHNVWDAVGIGLYALRARGLR